MGKGFEVKRFGIPDKSGGIKDVFGISPNMELQYSRNVPFTNTKSVLLDGINKCINITSVQVALASSTVGTFNFWVKPVTATPAGSEIITNFGDTDGSSELILFIAPTTGKCRAYLRVGGAFRWDLSTDAVALTSGVWNMVSIVKGIEPAIYINAVKVAQTFSVSVDKTLWLNDLPLVDNAHIGCRNINSLGHSLYFNGNFDESLFIERALTQPQLLDIYNGGVPKDETAIANGISQFRIDGDIVPTATDAIGSNNGTYINVIQADIVNDVP